MTHFRILVVLAALLIGLTCADAAHAQSPPPQGTIGLSGSLQSSQTIIALPIWLTPQVTLAPNLGFTVREDARDDLILGAEAHFYTRRARVAPYLGPRLLILIADPDTNADTRTDLLLGGLGGAEFFLTSQFSFSVEGQLNVRFNDNRGNTFGTGTAVRATVYF